MAYIDSGEGRFGTPKTDAERTPQMGAGKVVGMKEEGGLFMPIYSLLGWSKWFRSWC